MKKLALVGIVFLSLLSCKNENKTTAETQEIVTSEEMVQASTDFSITPIEHATAVFNIDNTIFYIDPVGGAEAFLSQPKPNVILVTDIHGDHFNAETIIAVVTPDTKIYAPQAVYDQMEEGPVKDQFIVIGNGETLTWSAFSLKAIPMYNLREEAKNFHPMGRGNGYVIEKDDLRVYFSGDTEDIPEMRNLENIDKAFVCMNLPYTMTVESAADAVLAFKPEEVYSYHFRGQGGFSDVEKFKKLVNEGNPEIKVEVLDWYPKRSE